MSIRKKQPPLDLNSDIYFSGFIKYKKSKNLQFNTYYGILNVKGIFLLLHHTNDKRNRNVYFSISMKDVSRVEPVLYNKEPYSFMLVPYISTKNVVYLSAFKESEMKTWIFKFTEVRKNLHVSISDVFFDPYQNDQPQYLDLDINTSNVECYDSYSTSQSNEPGIVDDLIILDQVEPPVNVNVNNSYDEFSVEYRNLNTDLISEESSQSIMKSINYYDSANFFGTENESFQILKQKSFNGSYIVRTDSLSKVNFLDVWDDYLLLSFELIYQDNYVQLKGDSKHFDNITYLLHHYSFNKLPNSCSHLEIPFRLEYPPKNGWQYHS